MKNFNLPIIYNPNSGGGNGERIAQKYSGLKIPIADLKNYSPDDLNIYDEVVVAGGDGTVSSALCWGKNTKLGFNIIALGTGNDIAREILLYQVNELAIFEFRNDSGKFKREFCAYLSFGFDAEVADRFSQHRSTGTILKRRAEYFKITMSILLKPPVGVFKFNTEEKKLINLLFANIRSVAGMFKSNNLSNPADSEIEQIEFKSQLDYLNFFAKGLKAKSYDKKSFEIVKPIKYQIDGEAGEEISGRFSIQHVGKTKINGVI